jgi:choice-of-anchor B domain-containing protein
MKKLLPFFACLLVSMIAMAQKNIAYRSSLSYPNILSNLWGYTDTISGKEYAIVGEETGLSIVDISLPDLPQKLFFVPTDTSLWKEPKVWSHYAYCTNEKGGGLLIVDLSNLPAFINYTNWSGVPNENYTKSHTLFIDENGILYLNGSNLFNRGVILCDLKPDPLNPQYLGKYDDAYVHDCFARNDTLYVSEILDGRFSVVDVKDKSNPVVLARQTTPFFFSHNIWPDDNNDFVFNTDEKKFASVTVYDVRDLENIKEVEQYRHSDSDSSIPHNTYYKDGYLYTSYYRDGVTIVDAHRPDNLVEIGQFDTSPFASGDGFEGCWGVYPFFNSGNIICSDREEGLFVLTPTLTRACYLEGKVTDQNTGNNLNNIRIDILGHERFKYTDLFGRYKTGIADSGFYTVRFTDFNQRCATKIVSGVRLDKAQTTILNVTISCTFPSSITEINSNIKFGAAPNVFSQNTSLFIEHELPQTNGSVYLFDSKGQLVRELVINTARTEIIIGDELPSGVYFARLDLLPYTQTIKLVKVQ